LKIVKRSEGGGGGELNFEIFFRQNDAPYAITVIDKRVSSSGRLCQRVYWRAENPLDFTDTEYIFEHASAALRLR